METYPTFEEFLALPTAEVAKVTPKSVMFVPGLSRRGALLHNVTDREEYARWGMQGWLRCVDMLFQYGVQHLFILQLSPSNYKEHTQDYREHLAKWTNAHMASETAQQWYKAGQWRVRILYHENLPEFQPLSEKLTNLTGHHTNVTLWNMFIPEADLPERWLLDKLRAGALPATPAETIQYLYGAAIPPIDLYLSFGKPIISPLPPFLAGKMQCYWGQFCTYDLTHEQLRAVLYDCLYTRATWKADKKTRAEELLRYRAVWEAGHILGLGMRLGSYWYPQPTPPLPPPGGG